MNENIDIDTTFVPDDSASHSWAERDSGLWRSMRPSSWR